MYEKEGELVGGIKIENTKTNQEKVSNDVKKDDFRDGKEMSDSNKANDNKFFEKDLEVKKAKTAKKYWKTQYSKVHSDMLKKQRDIDNNSTRGTTIYENLKALFQRNKEARMDEKIKKTRADADYWKNQYNLANNQMANLNNDSKGLEGEYKAIESKLENEAYEKLSAAYQRRIAKSDEKVKRAQEEAEYWKNQYNLANDELINVKKGNIVKDQNNEDELEKQNNELVKKAQQEMQQWKNQYYKAYADMANLRKEIEKDHKEVKKYRIEGFVEELVRTLDAFEMAIKVKPKNEETKNYLVGFKYVYNQILDTLKKEGVEIIDPKVGDVFDENVMHCVETVEDSGEENIIKEVSTKGYKLHDHLIRAAMVVVTKHKVVENKVVEKGSSKKTN